MTVGAFADLAPRTHEEKGAPLLRTPVTASPGRHRQHVGALRKLGLCCS